MDHQLSSDLLPAFDSGGHSSLHSPFVGTSDAAGARSTATALDDLAHEVRQPLSVIESLAYYLELTCTDEKTRAHLQRIQAMVLQASLILKRSCRSQVNAATAE